MVGRHASSAGCVFTRTRFLVRTFCGGQRDDLPNRHQVLFSQITPTGSSKPLSSNGAAPDSCESAARCVPLASRPCFFSRPPTGLSSTYRIIGIRVARIVEIATFSPRLSLFDIRYSC